MISLAITVLSFCYKVSTGAFYVLSKPLKLMYKFFAKTKEVYGNKKPIKIKKEVQEPALVGNAMLFSSKSNLTPNNTSHIQDINSINISNKENLIKDLKKLSPQVKNKEKIALIEADIENLKTDFEGDKKLLKALLKFNNPLRHLCNVSIEHNNKTSVIDHIIITNNYVYAVSTSTTRCIDKEVLIENEIALKSILGNMISNFTIKSCFVATSNDIDGDYTIDTFISSIERNTTLDPRVNKIGNILSEFNVPLISNYLDKYDLNSLDFN